MISQREVSQIAFREGISDRTVEKDYVITWLLCGLSQSALAEHLAFKGGTALRKTYFANYRYSEDLDFTIVGRIERAAILDDLSTALKVLARERGFEFELPERGVEQRAESMTAHVRFVGPLGARRASRDVKIDFTLVERLVFPTVDRCILSNYSDRIDRTICTYAIEEIVVEKLCAVIGRTEPRDIYDLHYLFQSSCMDGCDLRAAFAEKAAFKNIAPAHLQEVLIKKRPTIERMWDNRLRHQVKDLPYVDQVFRELQRNMRAASLFDVTMR